MGTIKFWFFWNDTFSKLKIKDGETITLYQYSRCCEGWSSYLVTFKREGNTLYRETTNDGRDCDGRLTQGWEDVAVYPENFYSDDVSDGAYSSCYQKVVGNTSCRCSSCKAQYYPGVRVSWQNADSYQRDEYAELAGY